VLVRKLHFRRHKRERLCILKLHSGFQTESRHHNAQAAALNDPRDVAALDASAQTLQGRHRFLGDGEAASGILRTFCLRNNAAHTCERESTRRATALQIEMK
jgi:hypothetical protein